MRRRARSALLLWRQGRARAAVLWSMLPAVVRSDHSPLLRGAARTEGGEARPYGAAQRGSSRAWAAPCAADWDGDGDLDLLLGTARGAVEYYERLPDGRLKADCGAALLPFAGISTNSGASPEAADWDGDGDLDLLLGASDGSVALWERLEGGNLTRTSMCCTSSTNGARSIELGCIDGGWAASPEAVDWDGDGQLELFLGLGKGAIQYFDRVKDGSLGEGPDSLQALFVGMGASPEAADWDGDGDFDLLVGTGMGTIRYFEQVNGTLFERHGAASPFVNLNLGFSAWANPSAADWDGDGDLDLLVGISDGTLRYFERVDGATLLERRGAHSPFFHVNACAAAGAA